MKPGARVCLLQTLHTHDDKRMFHKLARSLVSAGYDVVSVTPDTGDVPAERDGVRFVTIPRAHGLGQRARILPNLLRAAREARADVLIAPEPESWCVALLAKWRFGGKVVFDMHEHVQTEFSKFFPGFMRPLVAWLTVKFMRLFARYTDLIILTRESFDAPWAGLKTPRVTVINTNHLQVKCTAPPPRQLEGGPILLHQGIFGDIRGSYQLLEAMKLLVARHPTIRCMVLGEYVYGSLEAYRAAIAAAGLDQHLLLLPPVPYHEVPAYVAMADVGLILFQPGPLNHTLAMPHKLFDYMREGKPVIAPAFSLEVARIVTETECGLLVDVTCPEAIAEAVDRLWENRPAAMALGEHGRRAVETKYNWEAEERALLAAMARL